MWDELLVGVRDLFSVESGSEEEDDGDSVDCCCDLFVCKPSSL